VPYRILSVLIVAFWLVMSGLLLRLQFWPEESGVLAVPVEHVLRLLFTHALPSNLNIAFGGRPYGSLSVRPNIAENGERRLRTSGNARLRLPLLPRDQLIWSSTLNLDQRLAFRNLAASLSLRETGTDIDFEIDSASQAVHYSIAQNKKLVRESTVPLSREGAAVLLRQAQLNPEILDALKSSAAPAHVSAKLTNFSFRHEKIEAYSVGVYQGETALLEIYVNQLGRILLVQSALGLSLAADNDLP
jgi:hypothetical protein